MKKLVLLGTLSMCLFACSNKAPKVKDIVRKMDKDELIEVRHNGVTIYDDVVASLYEDQNNKWILSLEVCKSYDITQDATYDGIAITEDVTIVDCED